MGKIKLSDVDNYSQNTRTHYFKLENDKDTARVRFMYNTIDDVDFDVVHEVEIDGRGRFVNCLRSYSSPVDECPLCKAGVHQKIIMFVPVYNEDKKEVQFWQRGKKFINSLSGLCSRYNPLVSTVVEIERNGAKGDQATQYQLYPTTSDDTRLEDLPEKPDTLDSVVLNKSFEELSVYAESGSFDDNIPSPRESVQRRPVADKIQRKF